MAEFVSKHLISFVVSLQHLAILWFTLIRMCFLLMHRGTAFSPSLRKIDSIGKGNVCLSDVAFGMIQETDSHLV